GRGQQPGAGAGRPGEVRRGGGSAAGGVAAGPGLRGRPGQPGQRVQGAGAAGRGAGVLRGGPVAGAGGGVDPGQPRGPPAGGRGGRWQEGGGGYGWGFGRKRGERPFDRPRCRGEGLGGRTLLVWSEQGLGDTLQFARYAGVAARRGGRVVLEVPGRLLALLRG